MVASSMVSTTREYGCALHRVAVHLAEVAEFVRVVSQLGQERLSGVRRIGLSGRSATCAQDAAVERVPLVTELGPDARRLASPRMSLSSGLSRHVPRAGGARPDGATGNPGALERQPHVRHVYMVRHDLLPVVAWSALRHDGSVYAY